jgi:hypothetical protein
LHQPSPPYNEAIARASGQLGTYQFVGALVAAMGVYYLLAQLAGDEYFKRSTVWGRIPFGVGNILWGEQASEVGMC